MYYHQDITLKNLEGLIHNHDCIGGTLVDTTRCVVFVEIIKLYAYNMCAI